MIIFLSETEKKLNKTRCVSVNCGKIMFSRIYLKLYKVLVTHVVKMR